MLGPQVHLHQLQPQKGREKRKQYRCEEMFRGNVQIRQENEGILLSEASSPCNLPLVKRPLQGRSVHRLILPRAAQADEVFELRMPERHFIK